MRNRLLFIGAVMAAAIGMSTRPATSSPAATSLAAAAAGPCGSAAAPPATGTSSGYGWRTTATATSSGTGPRRPTSTPWPSECGLATNYHNISHPSLPNYLAATSGLAASACRSCPGSTAARRGLRYLGGQHLRAGRDVEGLRGVDAVQLRQVQLRRIRRAPQPAAVLRRSCPGAPATTSRIAQLAADLAASALPAFSFITPNLIDDMHDGTIAQGDAWLASHLPAILSSRAYRAGPRPCSSPGTKGPAVTRRELRRQHDRRELPGSHDRGQPEHPGRHQIGDAVQPLLPARDRGATARRAQAGPGIVVPDHDRRVPPLSRGCLGWRAGGGGERPAGGRSTQPFGIAGCRQALTSITPITGIPG